jgi:hypothetical protein
MRDWRPLTDADPLPRLPGGARLIDSHCHLDFEDFDADRDAVFARATAAGRTKSYYLSGVYRFAAYKNDRFEIGPALGLGYLSIEAGISGQGSITTPSSGTTTRPFDVSNSLGQPTGDLGAYFYWWPARRLLARGDLRYIIVKPGDSEASITDGRAALIYHIGRHVGLGLQYTYSKFRYDRETLSRDLGGVLRYSGGQVVLSGAF